MRPDRVYATGVLAPMVGYQPQVDVQSVAQEFTQGAPLATMLQGLGGLNFFQKLKLRFQAARARRHAAQFMFAGPAGMYGLQGPPGPARIMGAQVAPQIASQMQMVMHLPERGGAHAVWDAAQEAAMRRNNTFYRAG